MRKEREEIDGLEAFDLLLDRFVCLFVYYFCFLFHCKTGEATNKPLLAFLMAQMNSELLASRSVTNFLISTFLKIITNFAYGSAKKCVC